MECTTSPKSAQVFVIVPGRCSSNSHTYVQSSPEEMESDAGRNVRSGSGRKSVSTENDLVLDVSNLNTGVYFISIENESGKRTLQFIKK